MQILILSGGWVAKSGNSCPWPFKSIYDYLCLFALSASLSRSSSSAASALSADALAGSFSRSASHETNDDVRAGGAAFFKFEFFLSIGSIKDWFLSVGRTLETVDSDT